MADITVLILDDHDWFRRAFAGLDDAQAADADADALDAIWEPLGTKLDAHAEIEEEIFYPALLAEADEDGEETEDAIGDHNKIRDAVAQARRSDTGSEKWWAAVGEARKENDEHMAEEEREGLSDFRLNATPELRDELGRRWLARWAEHPGGAGIESPDKDPVDYIDEHTPAGDPRPEQVAKDD